MDDFDSDDDDARAPPARRAHAPPRRSAGGPAQEALSLSSIVAAACTALGRSESEAADWTRRLRAEWVTSLAQLRALGTEEWARLCLPVGLESELKRQLRVIGGSAGGPPGQAGSLGEAAEQEAGRRKVQPRRAPTVRKAGAVGTPGAAESSALALMPPTPLRRAAPGGAPKKPADAALLRSELHSRFGEDWSLALLRILRKLQAPDQVLDLHNFQVALRGLGIAGPAASPALLRGVLQEAGGTPGAEDVVCAIHGSLRPARAEALRALFRDLAGGDGAMLSVPALRRRCNILEHPGVRAGMLSAEDALRSLMKKWLGRDAVSETDFVAAHLHVSALHPGDDMGFTRRCRGMWRCAEQLRVSAPFVAPQQLQEASAADGARGAAAAPPGAAPAVGIVDHVRRRLLQDRIRRSSRAHALLERLRTVLRRRGHRGCKGQGGDEMLETLASKFRASVGCRPSESRRTFQRKLFAEALRLSLNQVGVGAAYADVEDLLVALDMENSGTFDFEDLLAVVRGGLFGTRAAVVREAYEYLDRNHDGVLSLEEVQLRFRPIVLPDVEAGRKDADDALQDILLRMGAHGHEGNLTFADFERYYEGVSAGIDNDQYFKHIVFSSWGLESDERCRYARNQHRALDGHLQVTEFGICGRNDGW